MVPCTNSVFTARETHGRALRSGNRLVAHSQDVGWRSLYAAILEEAPFTAIEPAIGHPFLIYHLSRPTEVARKIEGAPRERSLIGPRRICLTPGETVTEWQHSGHPEILQVYLRQSLYEAAVSEMYGCDPSSAELVPRFAVVDPLLEQLAIAIAGALRDGTAEDSLYVETLAQTLAVHLARAHSSRSRPARTAQVDAISGPKMRRLIEFIEQNLDSNLSLETMAAEVIVESALPAARLQNRRGPIAPPIRAGPPDRARQGAAPRHGHARGGSRAGFRISSQSHLSNWFLREVGISPAAYRRQGIKNTAYLA